MPQHKVDDKELKKETTLSRDATFDEKELVASNDRKIWEKDADNYNKQHGFSGNSKTPSHDSSLMQQTDLLLLLNQTMTVENHILQVPKTVPVQILLKRAIWQLPVQLLVVLLGVAKVLPKKTRWMIH